MNAHGLLMAGLLASVSTTAWAQSTAAYGPEPASAPAPRLASDFAPPPGMPAAEMAHGTGTIAITSVGAGTIPAIAPVQTLRQALGEVYLTSPPLLAERAKLRATDENVPTALSGWRPQISYSLAPGFGYGTITNKAETPANPFLNSVATTTDQTFAESRWVFEQQVTATQPVYRGGRTTAATAQAEDDVRGERANLLAEEEQAFSTAISAYVGLVQDQQLYDLNADNVVILTKTLQATDARFAAGELTRTDVAQAQAALAQAIAARETSFGTLQTALATYREDVGPVPARLVEPQPLMLPAKSEQQAETVALANNASIINAAYTDAAAKDAVNVAYAALMPQVSLQVSAQYANQANIRGLIERGGEVGGQITVPIYQGGAEYAAIRQAKQSEQQSRAQLDNARLTAVQQVGQYWTSYVAAAEAATSTRQEVRANEIALDGTEREALAGTATTTDVLNAEQALLSARVTLVQNLAAVVSDSYLIAGAMGRLTARDLALNVPRYDEKAYYNDVRLLPFGTGDYATHQPGR